MLGWGYLAGCPVWPSDLGDEFRQNFETDIPAVIAHGTWDTSTPFENALELVPFFTNSKFIPVIRGPHGAIVAARQGIGRVRQGNPPLRSHRGLVPPTGPGRIAAAGVGGSRASPTNSLI